MNAIILANAAIPVFLFVSPALAVLLPAVILIETAWSGRLLGVGWRQALRPVTIANLASTFLGAVVLAIALSFAGTLFHYTLGAFIGPFDRNPLTELEQFLVAAFWVAPWGKTAQWMPAVGLLSFLVLSFVVSLKVERRIVAHYLPAVPGASVAKFALVAHCCSYGFLLAVMLLPVFFLLSR